MTVEIRFWNHCRGDKKILLSWSSYQEFRRYMDSYPLGKNWQGRFSIRMPDCKTNIDFRSPISREELVKDIEKLIVGVLGEDGLYEKKTIDYKELVDVLTT